MQPEYGAVMTALKRRYRERAASQKGDPWRTLLFTMLTARSRDDQVEPVFRLLMLRYKDAAALAKADVSDVAACIRGIGLYRGKSRNAVAMARAVMSRHDGKVPMAMGELVALPGVGTKTASCVLVYAFGIPAVAVDTHVHRIANRLRWVRTSTPEKTEAALRSSLPKRHWMDVNRVMVQFGRDVCLPGRPRCGNCPVRKSCAFPGKTAASAG